MRYGGIEAGGTKFVVAISDEQQHIIKQMRIDTEAPAITMPKVVEFFQENPVSAIGIGCFGPIDIDPQSLNYGYITETPKVGWRNFNFLNVLKKALTVPMYWTTDVNVAAWGEYCLGAGKRSQHLFYSTVGTGIGGSMINNDQFYQARSHPETGHIPVRRYYEDDYKGSCAVHGDCLEGLAAGPAIEARAGVKAKNIASDDDLWQQEAYYLAQACMTYTLLYAPEKIVLGGGVSNQAQLFPLIRNSFEHQLKNYVDVPPLEQYIVHAELGDQAGIVGALLLAEKTYKG